MQKELAKAIAFAADIHKDQLDKGGQPYILHPMWVMRQAAKRIKDPRVSIVAICHDTIEDKWADDFEAGFKYFRENVTKDATTEYALRLLTHKKTDDYMDYIRHMKEDISEAGIIAVTVKIEDLRHNSDMTRIKGLRKKDLDRAKKYNAAYCYLTGQTYKLLDLVE